MSDREMTVFECKRCYTSTTRSWSESTGPGWATMASVCHECERSLPESLMKACGDEFDYLLELRTGTRFRFAKAALRGEFVHLEDIREFDGIEVEGRIGGYSFDRGIDVRIADIVWCVDAPQGS